MFRRIVFAAMLFAATFNSRAVDFTDVYYSAADGGGWGAFVVQSDSFQFISFFVFDQNGKPTWYTCQVTLDQNGNYSGTLYSSTGSYFGGPWNPAAAQTVAVGTCSFAPIDAYHATLTYSLTGGPTVVKTIQRIPLTTQALAGDYSGSAAGSISGCQDPRSNDTPFRGRFNLTVLQNDDAAVAMTLRFVDNDHAGIVCNINGPVTHFGRQYQLNGQAACAGPGFATGLQAATVDGLQATGQGIEGRWTGSLGGGCIASLHFSAVKNVNN